MWRGLLSALVAVLSFIRDKEKSLCVSYLGEKIQGIIRNGS